MEEEFQQGVRDVELKFKREIEAESNNGWLPISKAPRDGTVVDLWHKDGFRIPNCYWVKHSKDWRTPLEKYLLTDDQFTHFKHITGPEDGR